MVCWRAALQARASSTSARLDTVPRPRKHDIERSARERRSRGPPRGPPEGRRSDAVRQRRRGGVGARSGWCARSRSCRVCRRRWRCRRLPAFPLTARGYASSVAIVTGHSLAGAPAPIPSADTIVVLMGVSNAAAIRDQLIAVGLAPVDARGGRRVGHLRSAARGRLHAVRAARGHRPPRVWPAGDSGDWRGRASADAPRLAPRACAGRWTRVNNRVHEPQSTDIFVGHLGSVRGNARPPLTWPFASTTATKCHWRL